VTISSSTGTKQPPPNTLRRPGRTGSPRRRPALGTRVKKRALSLVCHAHSQFENRLRREASPGMPLVRCFTRHNHSGLWVALEPSYPEGNFEGNQLLDGSIGLSPLCHTQATQFARQNSDRPPPQFPTASSWNGIVHHLSGPMDLASTQNRAHWASGPVSHADWPSSETERHHLG